MRAAGGQQFAEEPGSPAGLVEEAEEPGGGGYLVLMRYWARATWSALPLMVIVRSCLLASSEASSYLLMVMMAPVICLREEGGEVSV